MPYTGVFKVLAQAVPIPTFSKALVLALLLYPLKSYTSAFENAGIGIAYAGIGIAYASTFKSPGIGCIHISP